MHVNQAGEEVFDEYVNLRFEGLTTNQTYEVFQAIFDKLNVDLYRTNATKHGHTEFYLKGRDD